MKARKKISNKILLIVAVPVLIATAVSIFVASINIRNTGTEGLQAKSEAILNRMESVRKYVATQGFMHDLINESLEKYPNGKLPEEFREKIKKQVPIIASWSIGRDEAEKDHYQFRISAQNPRAKENLATKEDEAYLEQFRKGKKDRIIVNDRKKQTLTVMSPVYLSEAQGCLVCHGQKKNSPYGNGNDILGYEMEGMQDGSFKGMFIITSDLKPLTTKTNKAILNISLLGLLIAAAGILLAFFIAKKIINAIQHIKEAGERITEGEYDTVIEVRQDDETGALAESIRKMVQSFKKGADYAKKISSGDLTGSMAVNDEKLSPLENELRKMEKNLIEAVDGISEVARKLSAETNQVTAVSEEISSGAAEQASAAEEVSASMKEMVANINQNAENAEKAEDIANRAFTGIEQSNKSFDLTMRALQDITDKIKVINDIAKKTDVLAINAAIESSRAGEAGKGFAVVAAEIRELAESSQRAAKEIEELADSTVNVANDSARQLSQLTPDIQENAVLVRGINTASREQNIGADQINNALTELNKVIQQNTAGADSMANNSMHISYLADVLNKTIAFFRTDKTHKIS